jgi:hypothetical protein
MAVHVGRAAVRRSAVLTRFPHRPPEVGVPGENPSLAERGLILTDFVDRVGDPVPMIGPDGSSHRAEVVLVDALRAVLLTLFGNRPVTEPVGVAYPAHWRPAAVDALRGALATVPEFRAPLPALLVSDATAALTALQQDPGVPARGVIAVCDFGATGTGITLADASNGFQPIGPTVRHVDLSGELIDQALLTRVVAGLSSGGAVDVSGTSAIGSLGRLRAECRAAKERLSTTTVTSMPVDLPGAGGEIRVTRNELDDAVRAPLADFVAELQDTVQRSGIRPVDLVAVASVGGGARIPIITTTLSEHLRVPVITAPAPELAAGIGSGLKAVRSTVEEGATSMAPVATAPPPLPPVDPVPNADAPPASSAFRALAWSDAGHVPDVAAAEEYGPATQYAEIDDPGEIARPSLDFSEPDPVEAERAAAVPWYRRPVAIVAGAVLLVAAILGTAAAYILTSSEEGTDPVQTSTVSASTTPPASGEQPPPSAEQAPPVEQAPAPETQTVTEQAPPPATDTPAPPAPPPSEAPPPPAAEPPPPVTETQTVTETAPPPAQQSPSSQAPVPAPPYSTVPGMPWVPTIPGVLQPANP